MYVRREVTQKLNIEFRLWPENERSPCLHMVCTDQNGSLNKKLRNHVKKFLRNINTYAHDNVQGYETNMTSGDLG